MSLRLLATVIALLCLTRPAYAQQPVVQWADWASYGTAIVNPTLAAAEAWRAPDRKCRLAQLALTEGVQNGVNAWLKHVINSPRPCIGCAPDGMPSGHTGNSFDGFSATHWRLGLTFGIATGLLRHEANRHTWTQILAGASLGIGSEAVGHLLHCQ